MRTRFGWTLVVLGLLLSLGGLAIMVVLGPDSRMMTGPHAIGTDGIAVVTAPGVITWADVQIDVLAEVPVQKPIFIGLANSVDVQNYVARTSRVEITSYRRPWTIQQRLVEGQPRLPGAPTAVDWWIERSAGLGGASISTNLPDQTVSIAVLSVGSSNLSGLKISVAYGIKGGFARGVGAALLGVGGLLLGLLMIRGGGIWRRGEEDEVVYVYIDDAGVEHQLSAEEAEGYEVVGEAVVVEEAAPVDEVAAAEQSVVYVYIDDAGVEHEVSESELGDFEVVDEEDEK